MTAKLFAALLLFTTLQATSQPSSRWTLSQNPWGLLEGPAAAIGLGVGYRLNSKFELWSETSLIRNLLTTDEGPINGIRQILQLKKFIDKDNHFFMAAEVRYKYFSVIDSNSLYVNANTRDTLHSFTSTSYHNVIGAAFQLGYRAPFSRHSRFSLELTAGIGIKNKYISTPQIPPGYKYTRYSVDFNAWIIMQTPGANIYLPGSARIIYSIP